MICPKLSAGSCSVLKNPCPQKYEIKMVKHSKCSVFKGKKTRTSKVSKLSKKAKTKTAKRKKSARKR